MNSIKTIIKYELIRYFLSPLAYVYLVGFLLLSGSCAIYFGHFLWTDTLRYGGFLIISLGFICCLSRKLPCAAGPKSFTLKVLYKF